MEDPVLKTLSLQLHRHSHEIWELQDRIRYLEKKIISLVVQKKAPREDWNFDESAGIWNEHEEERYVNSNPKEGVKTETISWEDLKKEWGVPEDLEKKAILDACDEIIASRKDAKKAKEKKRRPIEFFQKDDGTLYTTESYSEDELNGDFITFKYKKS